MAKDLTPHQKGIIKRFYENRENIGIQKLTEIISDLYVETDAAKQGRLWASALTALKNAGVKEEEARRIVKCRSLEKLAKKAEELF